MVNSVSVLGKGQYDVGKVLLQKASSRILTLLHIKKIDCKRMD